MKPVAITVSELNKYIKNKVDEDTEAVENSEKCPTIRYDLGTSDYGLSADGIGISVLVDKSRKSARISYNGATISQALGLGWVTAADTTTYELIDTKTFDKKIAQVLVDGSGQSSSSVAILYLMEDGTVEVVQVYNKVLNESKSGYNFNFNDDDVPNVK